MRPANQSEGEIFDAVLACSTLAERAAYLDQACAGRPELRQRVEALLAAHEAASQFLEPKAAANPTIRLEFSGDEKPGDVIGHYKIREKIGEGGCGVVYVADQEQPVRRRVALKVVKLGMDTKQVVARFEAERQALALMDHPNIAKVLDAGATSTGRPFFVMELVRGIKITDYCDQNNLSTEDRLKLFMLVCQAVQHAHQKGIIHRDLKPSNVLVTLHDGVPVPKVIDFGIAKATSDQRLTDKTIYTAFEQFLGTPAYMSPEQAEMSGLDIDTRSDIYSLGVLLYELLTGKTPFDAKTLLAAGIDQMRRIIREQEPQRPSTRLSTLTHADLTTLAKQRHAEPPKLINLISGDLDWIVMRCLEKDRTRRYETANGLAVEIQRHLSNEPIIARPPSATYRFQKMFRRNKLAFAASAAISVALILGLAATTFLFLREKKARVEAKKEAVKSQQVSKFLEDMLSGTGPAFARGRDTTMLREVMDKMAERLTGDLNEQPEVESELRHKLGEVYLAIGADEKAEAMNRRALELRTRLYGKESLAVAESKDALARGLYDYVNTVPFLIRLSADKDKLDEAELLCRSALETRKKVLGLEHPTVIASMSLLGEIMRETFPRSTRESEPILREVLALTIKTSTNDALKVAEAKETLATVIRKVPAQRPEAESMQREVLETRRRLLGSDHPDTALAMYRLGVIVQSSSLPDSERIFREVVELRRKLLGTAHPHFDLALASLANVLQYQGKYADAEKYYLEDIQVRKKLYGVHHRKVAAQLFNAGEIAGFLNKTADEQKYYREALDTYVALSQTNGLHDPLVETAIRLGKVLAGAGKAKDSDAMKSEVLDLVRLRAEAGNVDAQMCMGKIYLNGTLADSDDKVAEQWFRRAAQQGDVFAARNLGDLLQSGKLGEINLAEAAKWQAKAADGLRQLVTRNRTGIGAVADVLANLTRAQLGLEDWVAAEKSARECLAARTSDSTNDWRYFEAKSLLGASYLGQNKYAEAEPLLVDGLDGMQKKASEVNWNERYRYKDAYERLCLLFEKTGRTKTEAEKGRGIILSYIGDAYYWGGGVARAYDQARVWYGKADEQKDDYGQFQLAQMHEYGHGGPANITKAIECYRKAADHNHAGALIALGRIYKAGTGVEKNPNEAIACFRKAANQMRGGVRNQKEKTVEFATVLADLAETLMEAGDFSEAEQVARESLATIQITSSNNWEYFEAKSVLGRSLISQSKYGQAEKLIFDALEGMQSQYERSDWQRRPELKNTYEQACLLYEKTGRKSSDVEKGRGKILGAIGDIYLWGNGTKRDNAEAARWYQKAADQNDLNGQTRLAEMYLSGDGVATNTAAAIDLYLKIAEKTNDWAMLSLVRIYDQGLGVETNRTEAFKWYLKAAEIGNWEAQTEIVERYDSGIGVPTNTTEAFKWTKKLAEVDDSPWPDWLNGYPLSLARRYELGLGTEANPEEAKKVRGAFVEKVRKKGKSSNVAAMNTAAWFFAVQGNASTRDGKFAIELAEKVAAKTDRKTPGYLNTLAAAYAEAGRFQEAVATQKEAIALSKTGQERSAFISHLKLYEAGKPFHEEDPELPASFSSEEIYDPLYLKNMIAAEGKVIKVQGLIVALGKSNSGKHYYLNFTQNYRDSLSLSFAVEDDNVNFTSANLAKYTNQTVIVEGKVEMVRGLPQILVKSINQLAITNSPAQIK